MEKVLCAAIYYDDGVKYNFQPKNIETGFVVCGHRHSSCLEILRELFSKDKSFSYSSLIQGFLTSENRFFNRKEARDLVLKTGQFNKTTFCDELYSEDLY